MNHIGHAILSPGATRSSTAGKRGSKGGGSLPDVTLLRFPKLIPLRCEVQLNTLPIVLVKGDKGGDLL